MTHNLDIFVSGKKLGLNGLIGVTTHTVILNIPYTMASIVSRPEPNRPLDITSLPGWGYKGTFRIYL